MTENWNLNLGLLAIICFAAVVVQAQDCVDNDSGCSGWKYDCGAGGYVDDNCKATCGFCSTGSSGCSDSYTGGCSQWSKNSCKTDTWLQENCKAHCGLCTPGGSSGGGGGGNRGGSCEDTDGADRCQGWKSFCVNDDYVQKNCRKTCGYCGSGSGASGSGSTAGTGKKSSRRRSFKRIVGVAPIVGADCQITGCGSGSCQEVIPGQFRCKSCPPGFMGPECRRPCQNIYHQCTTRWDGSEGQHSSFNRRRDEPTRCRHRAFTAFFDDNCPVMCNQCTAGDLKLEVPIPIQAEPLAWIMGRWETTTFNGDRYPVNMPGAYREVLQIKPEKITMFDRPSLNVSAYAQEVNDPSNIHHDVGFLTSRFGNEDTGFARNKDSPPLDLQEIGLSLNGNTGINSVEEGDMTTNGRIDLKPLWFNTLPGLESTAPKNATRSFSISGNTLTETTQIEDHNGSIRSFTKTYTKTDDYLSPIPKTDEELQDANF